MKKNALTILFVLTVTLSFAQNYFVDKSHLQLEWKTDAVFDTPEGVVYHPGLNQLFVSNVGGNSPWTKDGHGFISIIDLEGNLIVKEWVTGIDGPKGMGIFKNYLYVTNLDEVIKIDITKGEIIKRIPVENAEHLNDIAIDKDGRVYVSDSKLQKVHVLVNDAPLVYYEDDAFINSNGVFISDEKILLGTGENIVALPANGKAETVLSETGKADGIAQIGKDVFVYSHWTGAVFIHKIGQGQQKVLEYPDAKMNTADICYIPEMKLLFVPTFFTNTIECYKVSY